MSAPRIVFDLDGTLIDSAPDIRGVANAVLGEIGVEPITLVQTRRFIGQGAPVFVQRMRAARGLPDSDQEVLLARFKHHYADAVGLTHVYPGTIEALEALKARGYRLGICTNKPIAPCRTVVEHLGLTRFFEVQIGGDSLVLRKPDPEPLHAAYAELGDGPRLYVGDSEVDAQTAVNAEVPFLLHLEGYRSAPPEELPHVAAFSDFAALPGLVEQALERSTA